MRANPRTFGGKGLILLGPKISNNFLPHIKSSEISQHSGDPKNTLPMLYMQGPDVSFEFSDHLL